MSAIVTDRLELVALSANCLEALLAGRHADAENDAGITLPDGWPAEDDLSFLSLRAQQLRKNDSWQEWLVRAVTLREPERRMIGHAGFHGPPGINGPRNPTAVEIGYTILEPHRGLGYATEAASALIAWARSKHRVSRVIASVAPENAPSLAIVRKLGFVQTGTQWDEEDGEELVFELDLEGATEALGQDIRAN